MPIRSTSTRKKSPARTTTRRKSSLSRMTNSDSISLQEEDNEMTFAEGASVLARWPGTNLFYKAVVTYVRNADNEYDVKYEDGTIFTIKARDVTRPNAFKRRISRGRSKSRPRDPEKSSEKPKRKSRKPTVQAYESESEREDVLKSVTNNKKKTLSKSTSAKTIPKATMDDYADLDGVKKKVEYKGTHLSKRSTMSMTNIKSTPFIDSDDEDDKVVSFNSSYTSKRMSNNSINNATSTPLFSNRLRNHIDSLDGKISTRTSARLASKLVELSSDDEIPKLAPNPNIPLRRTKKETSLWSRCNFEWLSCLFLMACGPLALLSLHVLCKSGSCRPAVPNLPKKLASYWDPHALALVFAEVLVISIFSLVPIGTRMTTANGLSIRKNGFLTLLACLVLIPVLVMQKIDIELVNKHYFGLMVSSFSLSLLGSIATFLYSYAYPGSVSNRNPKGNTGNIIVDFFHGREMNPVFWKFDLKLQSFRISMISLAMVNAILVTDYVMKNMEKSSPLIICAAVFQICYASDALLSENFYFSSYDALFNGYGFSLIFSYFAVPSICTLVVRYLLANAPVEAPWYVIASIVLVNLLALLIFRLSENQRCRFKINPNGDKIKDLDRMVSATGRKILTDSWHSFVRYPSYLGEVLIQWAWVLPAVMVAGKTDLLLYFLPVFVTLVFLVRCSKQNSRHRQMYGMTWDKYCEKVKSNMFPKVY